MTWSFLFTELTQFSFDGLSPRVKSRLRLQAALSLAHLSTVEKFGEKIAPNFVLLAVTIQVCQNSHIDDKHD